MKKITCGAFWIGVILFGFAGLTACTSIGISPSTPTGGELNHTTPEPIERTEDPAVLDIPVVKATENPTARAIELNPTQLAQSATTAPRSLADGEWMTLPVIPEVSERAQQIYAEGMRQGNDPHAFSKIGDCQNVPSMFVSIFDHAGFYSLGEPYAYLSETIDWYQGSFMRESMAVRRGFNAASLVSPVWADPEVCEIGEDPLHCELRIHNPSVAIVSLETWWAGNPDNYEKYIRQILEALIDQGVVPILATKADNVEGDHRINGILAGLAYEYQIPLWNFWSAIQSLPDHGLMEDGFHLTFAPNQFDDPQVMEAAWPWRNLTALQVLDSVRIALQNQN
ncbi:MAG: hypothetical protein E4G99_13400 [Anaerolineales bacterium]|nr:MAG: hypothetical protein E4G99_13400 [Anaerolineales bacterium]